MKNNFFLSSAMLTSTEWYGISNVLNTQNLLGLHSNVYLEKAGENRTDLACFKSCCQSQKL